MVAPASTLVDDFAVTLDRTKWISTSAAPNTYYDSTNQRVGVICTGSFFTLGTDFANPGYSIQNSSIFAKWTPSTPVSGRESHFDLQDGAAHNNVISFLVYGTNLFAHMIVAGVASDAASAPYNAVNHAWLRIRHTAGNIIWDTSPDGTNWTQFATHVYSFGTDAWALNVSAGGSTGGTDLFVDSINVAPVVAPPTTPTVLPTAWQPFTLRRTTGGDALRPAGITQTQGRFNSGFSTPQEQGIQATDLLLSQQVALMQDLGVGWHRSDYPVKTISPTAGTFDYSVADKWVVKDLAAGITPLPVLYILPTWMNGNANDKTPPTNNATFASWCATACTHLWSLGVEQVEIWNEPNLNTFWNVAAVTDANYRVAWANMMAAVYPAIKAAVPGMTVVLGGLSTTDTVFQTLGTPAVPGKGALSTFERWGELGVYANCDAVAWHPYLDTDLPCTDLGGWPGMNLVSAQNVLTILDNFAPGRNLKLWTTETGAPRSVPISQAEQSNRAHNVFATIMPGGCMASIRNRMGPILWFSVIDRPLGGTREQSFGFVSNDLSTHYQVYGDMKTYWATAWPDTAQAVVQSSLRYGPQDYSFDVVTGTTLTGVPYGYDRANITIQVPASVPNRGEMVLVRGGFGYPTTPLDGESVFYQPENYGIPVTTQFNQQVWDVPLTQGRWYYYTLFVKVSNQPYPQPATWMAAATEKVLVPKNYGHADKFFDMIPPYYQGLDNQQAGNGQNGPLRRFLAVLGYDSDYNRSLLDGVLNVYDPDLAPLQFTQQVGANLGLPPEQALGGARYRSFVGRLWELEGMRGTLLGLQEMIYATSNYPSVVLQGYNSLLSPDDAEFVHGVGHWLAYTNPHVVDMTNATATTHPPNDLYTYLQLRKYAGTFNSTGVATSLTLPALPPATGRGVMEIIEILVQIFTGMYGAQGTITGPSNFYPQSLAALIAAAPPVAAGVVPNYYAITTAGWWAGDIYHLPNGDTAHWTGTAWATGAGIVARPALSYVNAGAPGWMFPIGALPPANFAALPAPAIGNVHPPVAWKSGDYVQLQDGTTWHLEYQTQSGHPQTFWIAGVATLTIPATQGALGPIVGYNPKWQVADGSPAIAPADFATLRATTPMIIGRVPSSPIDRPWNPAQSYETLYLYDSTRVSWIGQMWGATNPGFTYLDARDVINNNLQLSLPTGGTGTAFVDAGAVPVGTPATGKLLAFQPAQSISGTYGTYTLPAGWSRIPWAYGDAAAPSGVLWTNPNGLGLGWTPASNVFAEFNSLWAGAGSNTNILAGTAVALFINGVEHSRSTADGNHVMLAHLVSVNVLVGQVCEIRVWSPVSQGFYLNASPTYGYNLYPSTWIAPALAIPATSGVWKATVAGHFSISAVVTPRTDYYTGGRPFWIMKNRVPIANGFLNQDNGELCRIATDTDVAVNDLIYVAIQRSYVPAIGQRVSYGSSTPTLAIARWEVS